MRAGSKACCSSAWLRREVREPAPDHRKTQGKLYLSLIHHVGAVEREVMLERRPAIEESVIAVARGLGMGVQLSADAAWVGFLGECL